jgi:ABC-type lipoprotein export system ATPase subunit
MALRAPMNEALSAAGQIERIQVEGGFLDGVEIGLAAGLNAVIGARGTGKTSIIELIRYCLDAPAITDLTATRARDHAVGVLGDGRVTLTLNVGGERIRVSRGSTDTSPDVALQFLPRPLVFSQNEIEAVGSDAASRRRLIDAFADLIDTQADRERATLARVASLTAQLTGLVRELQILRDEEKSLEGVEAALAQAESEQQLILRRADTSVSDQERLSYLDASLSALAVRSGVFARAVDKLQAWRRDVDSVLERRPELEDWPEAAGADDLLAPVRARLAQSTSALQASLDEADEAAKVLGDGLVRTRREEAIVAEQAGQLRTRLEAVSAGAGAASRKVAELRRRVGQRSSVTERIEQHLSQIRSVQRSRLAELDALDAMRESRYAARLTVIEALNRALKPAVRISIDRLGEYGDYAGAIANALRGSQVHYNTIAPILARAMSPRELVEAIERDDAGAISSLSDIDADRAQRVVNYLGARGTADILTAPVEDIVHFSFFDGREYKDVRNVSTGQRCTAVLSILLQHRDRVIVVDEPENHLDNAFIVHALVRSIRQRAGAGQVIVSTHNPNIPVLGDAASVVVLGSDAHTGYVASAAPLDTPVSVNAILDLMEGGREAFQRRAEFYQTP